MIADISDTLEKLDQWYRDEDYDEDRPMMLSKLATLELCGWIEEFMDTIILDLSEHCLMEREWVEKEVVEKIHGFRYENHFRVMACRVVGEHNMRIIEQRCVEQSNLDGLKSALGNLWKLRCNFAHQQLPMNIGTQATFNAPSWAKAQYATIRRELEALQTHLMSIARDLPRN